MIAALEQVLGDEGEEPFDLVEPTGIGRGEVHVEPRVYGQPSVDCRGAVGAVVVADQVHVQVCGDFRVDLGEELLELDGAVSAVQAGYDRPVAVLNAANRLVVPLRT